MFTIREGKTETLTLRVVLDPSVAGFYQVGLDRLIFSANPDGILSAQEMPIVQPNKFRTQDQFINN